MPMYCNMYCVGDAFSVLIIMACRVPTLSICPMEQVAGGACAEDSPLMLECAFFCRVQDTISLPAPVTDLVTKSQGELAAAHASHVQPRFSLTRPTPLACQPPQSDTSAWGTRAWEGCGVAAAAQYTPASWQRTSSC